VVRDEEAAGSNPANPATKPQVTGYRVPAVRYTPLLMSVFWDQTGANGVAGGPDTGQQLVKQGHRGHWRQRGGSPACTGAVSERRMECCQTIYTRSPSVLHARLLVCGEARAAGGRRVGVDAMRRVGVIVALTALLACPEGR
jgi:hypothetical protein